MFYTTVSSLLVLDVHLSFYIKQCDGWKAKISRFEIDDYIFKTGKIRHSENPLP